MNAVNTFQVYMLYLFVKGHEEFWPTIKTLHTILNCTSTYQILDWTMVDLVSRFHYEMQRIPFETATLRMCQKFKPLESCEFWISDTMINYLLFQKLKLLGNNKFNNNSNNI